MPSRKSHFEVLYGDAEQKVRAPSRAEGTLPLVLLAMVSLAYFGLSLVRGPKAPTGEQCLALLVAIACARMAFDEYRASGDR